MWVELCDEAESEARSSTRPTPTPADAKRRDTTRAAHLLGAGEQGKAWGVFEGVEFVDPAALSTARAFAALTPQAAPLGPEVTADEPGTAPFRLRRDTFDAQLRSLPSTRAGGTLHTVFETLQFVCEDPAAAGAMFETGVAALAGRAHQPAVRKSDLTAGCRSRLLAHTFSSPHTLGPASPTCTPSARLSRRAHPRSRTLSVQPAGAEAAPSRAHVVVKGCLSSLLLYVAVLVVLWRRGSG